MGKYRKKLGRCGIDKCGLGHGRAEGSWEHGNAVSGSIIDRAYTVSWVCQLLTKDSEA